jgi:phosphoribosylamine--glycine ligase
MGAVSPVPFLDDKFLSKIQNKIIQPTMDGIVKENMKYSGFIFIGLIKVNDEPYVIEYNVRMGDPETEVVFPRLKNDLLELFDSLGTPKFKDIKLNISDNHAATVILVSGGYPESYEKGKTIEGLNALSEVSVFHAGTKKKSDSFITSGGRVLAITSMGNNFELALKNSYNQINKIKFDGMNYRKDIGFDLL